MLQIYMQVMVFLKNLRYDVIFLSIQIMLSLNAWRKKKKEYWVLHSDLGD